eukprot:26097-Eustigmatos_ZCMA.PRE.1
MFHEWSRQHWCHQHHHRRLQGRTRAPWWGGSLLRVAVSEWSNGRRGAYRYIDRPGSGDDHGVET